MKINIKFIALLAIICLLSLSAVSADGDNQTDTGDLPATDDADNGMVNNDDAGQETDGGESNIQKTLDEVLKGNKISAANNNGVEDGDTIVLDKDYDLDATICIDNKITLDGQGHTLNGKNTVRVIAARTTDVTLQNIIFKNGQSDSGAGVWAKEGSITLINCTFINNKATGYGGAFYSPLSGNTIINCIFENNTAAQSGGALNINNNENTLINNTFKNNVATSKNGGAIAITGQNTAGQNIIKGNTFENNKATKGDAGALYLDKTNGDEISDNIFIKNTAMRGGAVSLYEAGYSTITNNTFTSNNATVLGGAVRESITDSDTKTTISNNKFKSNSAPNSGALHIDGSKVEINTNEFDGNKATQGYAGSIQINGNNIKILNNNISNTNAKTNGGAIVVKTGTSITIQSNNITNANANDGGAIHVESGAATIKSNNFTKCSASNRGGAIKSDTKVIVTENTFKSNTATDKGSDILIYYTGSKVSQIKNNDFVTYTTKSIVTFSVPVEIQDNKGIKETLKIETLNKNYAVTTTTKYLTVVLKNSRGTGVSGKTLTISLNGKTYTGTTNANGKYKTKIAISAIKKYSCTVKFAGDDTNLAAKNSFYLYVTKAATKISSPAKTFKKSAVKKVVVTLKSGKKVLAKKKVTLKINGKKYTKTTNARGKATIKIKITKKGSFKGTLKYTGNKTYKACTGKVTIKIK
ncbi:MAG: right-handed parallel beta-helix repeat-containing protein [Methanobrevibacter sp.]|uniref:right-handed parallel beta-helix repeat-containing protein n=1 Tax=Methanobrevibacter sp. TaxID=66852 RepID=UPI0025E8BFA4|nr:right-handed parallel beta-helix repeat-containing protein [Methanobrevibacter sp.]MBR6994167.1 right-handed parallel beta-helix repeat-containing protein [Methanobrevibacter sp.]